VVQRHAPVVVRGARGERSISLYELRTVLPVAAVVREEPVDGEPVGREIARRQAAEETVRVAIVRPVLHVVQERAGAVAGRTRVTAADDRTAQRVAREVISAARCAAKQLTEDPAVRRAARP